MINPYENREKSHLAIRKAEFISRWTATITTSAGAAVWGSSTALQYLPEGSEISLYISWGIGAVVAAVMGWLTDHAFGDILQRVVTDLISARHPNAVAWNGEAYFKNLRRAESAGFTVVLLLLFALDVYSTVAITTPVANAAKQGKIVDVAEETSRLSAQQKEATSPMLAQMETLKKEIADSERRAASGNASLSSLAASGNGWAKTQIAAKKAAASKSCRRQLESLQAAYAKSLTDAQESAANSARLINEQNQKTAQDNQVSRAVMGGMYLVFSVGPKILSILLRVLMVVIFFAYSSGVTLDLNGDGIINYADVEVYFTNMQAKAKERRQKAEQEKLKRQSGSEAFR